MCRSGPATACWCCRRSPADKPLSAITGSLAAIGPLVNALENDPSAIEDYLLRVTDMDADHRKAVLQALTAFSISPESLAALEYADSAPRSAAAKQIKDILLKT